MSEQIMKSVFEIFAQTQQTYAEAQKKRESEQTVKKIERFRTAEDGEYKVRVLPLAPVLFAVEQNFSDLSYHDSDLVCFYPDFDFDLVCSCPDDSAYFHYRH